MCAVVLLAEETPGWVLPVVVMIAAIMAMMFVMITLLLKQYKRCPPNRILVVYGKTGPDTSARCVHGGAVLIVPLLQDHAWLALEPMRIEVSRQRTASGRTISDPLPRVFSVAIGTSEDLMHNAAVRLLGLDQREIEQQAEDIIVTRLDRLIDAIDAGEVTPGTDEFYQRLETSIRTELNKLGLVLVNFRRE
ncbi:MAG: hypothetical protein A2V98_02030 [Planctomycetes bacterium RBG_16_64_12]|nr:MAG: hypothetical protein A2V98_02030 [Planctomycetes bacterium RBG_16_64_12]